MGPYHHDCPLSLLELAPEANPGWRQAVRQFHARKARVKGYVGTLKPGDAIRLELGYVPTVLTVVSNEDKILAQDPMTSKVYRVKPTMIALPD